MNALEQRRRRMADQRRSPRRDDQAARLQTFRAWVLRQGADSISLADATARLAITPNRAGERLAELVAEGVLEKIDKGEWRLRGRAL